MGTRYVTLENVEIHWAKVFEENRDLEGYQGNAVPFDGILSITCFAEKEEYEKLKEAKSMKYIPARHEQEDGRFKVQFERKWKLPYEWACGAIPVTKPDGTAWDYTEDGPIWNGSIANVSLAVYDIASRKVVGTRLCKVEVTEAAEAPEGYGEEEEAIF